METRPLDYRLWTAIVAAWAAMVAWFLFQGLDGLRAGFTDTDDAMRLVEMRLFAAGQSSWYDMVIDRVQPPEGLVSHWSRLIDLGLAGLQSVFLRFTGPAEAELLMRAIWPLLWLLPALAGIGLIAARLAGWQAGVLAAVLGVLAAPALGRFAPGIIDHHNVQIALAVLAVAASAWAGTSRVAAVSAGALTGLMLAIGLETAAFIALVPAVFALRFVWRADAGPVLTLFGTAMAASVVAALISAQPPARWGETLCDAVAINTALPMAAAAALMAIAGRFGERLASPKARLTAMAGIALGAGALFLALDPACIAGPFGHIDPAIKPIWLDTVTEARSLHGMLIADTQTAIVVAAYPFLTAVLAAAAWARGWTRNEAWIIAIAALVLSSTMMFAMIRATVYAFSFAIPVAAALVVSAWRAFAIVQPVPRLLCVLPAVPVGVSLAAFLLTSLVELPKSAANPQAYRACMTAQTMQPLTRLETGLIAAPINLGPAILVYTGHKVLAAPYHRLSRGIIQAHRIFAAPLDEAREAVLQSGADLVAYCLSDLTGDQIAELPPDSLERALRAGRSPGWLEPVDTGPESGLLLVFRVRR